MRNQSFLMPSEGAKHYCCSLQNTKTKTTEKKNNNHVMLCTCVLVVWNNLCGLHSVKKHFVL